MFRFNEIICETGLKPNSDTYTQLQHHQRRTLWSNIKSDYVSLWYTQFHASKECDILLCNDTEFDLHLVILNTLHWQLPFHSTLVTRRPYLGHDNWRLVALQVFSHYKVPLTFRYSWKRLRKLRRNFIRIVYWCTFLKDIRTTIFEIRTVIKFAINSEHSIIFSLDIFLGKLCWRYNLNHM